MSLSTTLLNYLGSAKNIVGAAVASGVAAGTIMTGAAGPLWPVVTGAAYGIAALVTPTRRRILDNPQINGVYTSAELRDALEETRKAAPAELREPTNQIAAGLRDIIDRWDRVQKNPNVANDVTAAILDYLPTTLRSYAAIPLAMRNEPLTSGRTARQSVDAQLAMLIEYVDETRTKAFADDLRQLEQQGAFLAEKWRANPLDLG